MTSKGSEAEHKQNVLNCLERLDDENRRINLPKCRVLPKQSGISPIKSKILAILALDAPKTLEKLQSFLGSVHYTSKFIPNLAQISHQLPPLFPLFKKII